MSLSKVFLITAAAITASSCGGGGGSNSKGATEPAPQTLNAIVFQPTVVGGPVLLLVRAAGDAFTTGETGAVFMNPGPRPIPAVDTVGQPTTLIVSPIITGGNYIYTRTSAVSGRLVIRGTGQTPPAAVPPAVAVPFYYGGVFSRTYDMLFSTDGFSITAIAITDYDTVAGIAGPGRLSTTGSMRISGGGLVPVGWTFDNSSGVKLPKIYPLKLRNEELELTSSGAPPVVVQRLRLLESTFTFNTPAAEGNFSEQGVGNLFIGPSVTPAIISYRYAPDSDTTDKATFSVTQAGLPPAIYQLTFTSRRDGDYLKVGGGRGKFLFPFLN